MTPNDCLVCGGAVLEPHFEVLLRCRGCGFVTARLEDPLDARGLYEGDYFTGGEYLDYAADESMFKRTFRRRLKRLLRRRSGGRLLEIGAAYGFFLELSRVHFEGIGFEVNPAAARHAREVCGLDVRTEDFLQADREQIGGPVDVTCMWDVIEHLERPDRFIEQVAALSNPGGLLLVTTGDIGSRLARRRGRKWRMIHPPTHLHYFDRSTLPRLLERYGFRVVDIRSVGVARSFRQVLYSILALRLGMGRAYEIAKKLVPASWGFTLNTFDIMEVVARRS